MEAEAWTLQLFQALHLLCAAGRDTKESAAELACYQGTGFCFQSCQYHSEEEERARSKSVRGCAEGLACLPHSWQFSGNGDWLTLDP